MQERYQGDHEQEPNYRTALENIISRPLVPELIDSYAENALNDLIALVEDCVRRHKSEVPRQYSSGRAAEEAAFEYYGLSRLEAILDNIADQAELIRQLDAVIDRGKVIDQVIIPPDPCEAVINGGGEQFEHPKPTIPKLKTLLFVLSNDFDVDVNDPRQVLLTRGTVNESMMRQTSYAVVELNSPARTIFICDEVKNATYVFDKTALNQNAISTNDLLGLTKTELNQLLKYDASLGRRIIFSNRFIANLTGAIEHPETPEKPVKDGAYSEVDADTARANLYLYPEMPEDYRTIRSLTKESHVDEIFMARMIQELAPLLGPLNKYRLKYRPRHVVALCGSPEQISMLKEHIALKRSTERAPDGFLSAHGIARAMGISAVVVRKAAAELGEELGETRRFRFGKGMTIGYSPEQQEMILAFLEAKGLFAPDAPEGYLSKRGIGATYCKYRLVRRAIAELGAALGETRRFRFGDSITIGYSPEQVEMIVQRARILSKSVGDIKQS